MTAGSVFRDMDFIGTSQFHRPPSPEVRYESSALRSRAQTFYGGEGDEPVHLLTVREACSKDLLVLKQLHLCLRSN